jgi:hypothetical protein
MKFFRNFDELNYLVSETINSDDVGLFFETKETQNPPFFTVFHTVELGINSKNP